MKTFAELKRDMGIGSQWVLIESFGKQCEKNRVICKTQSNGIYFKDETSKSGKSFLPFPPASLVEYDGETVIFYASGIRDLTSDELSIIDGMPSNLPENTALVERDLLTDGSVTFLMDKAYCEKKNALWYYGWHGGLRYIMKSRKMSDKKIKGVIELIYIRLDRQRDRR